MKTTEAKAAAVKFRRLTRRLAGRLSTAFDLCFRARVIADGSVIFEDADRGVSLVVERVDYWTWRVNDRARYVVERDTLEGVVGSVIRIGVI